MALSSSAQLKPEEVLARLLPKPGALSIQKARRFTAKSVERFMEGLWFARDRSSFEQFTTHPIIRGYEIVRRHPGFSCWRKSHPRQFELELAGSLPSWPRSNVSTREAFQSTFGGDLARLGILTPLAKLEVTLRRVRFVAGQLTYRINSHKFVLSKIGRLRVKFDCTMSRRSVLREFQSQLDGLPEFVKLCDQRTYEDADTRLAKSPLQFRLRSAFNPFVVSIDLTPLLVQLSKRDSNVLYFYAKSVIDGFETFLAKDRGYRRYREKCQRVKKAVRIKRVSPEVCALGCIAWDWQQMGRGLPQLSSWLHAHGISLSSSGIAQNPKLHRWEKALLAIRHCFKKIHLPATRFASRSLVKRAF